MSNLSIVLNEVEKKVKELTDLWDNGHLKETEYRELINDITDLTKLNDKLELEEDKIVAEKTIQALRQIAGVL